MANLTRFDPFRGMQMFNPFFDSDDVLKAWGLRPLLRDVDLVPEIKVDVSEDEKAYNVKADIPGVEKNDIHVQIDGNVVSITAEVKKQKEEKKGEVTLRSERYEGRQSRSFSLAHEIDSEKAQASYNSGVLQLTLPKKSGNGATREIAIS